MIINKIEDYLKNKGKTINSSVIDSSFTKFKFSVIRQFMQDRTDRPGNLYTTMVTKKCSRQAAYKYHGFEGKELSPRAKINFFYGDIIEIILLMLAEIADVAIKFNNEYLTIKDENLSLACKPDGFIEIDAKLYN